MTETSNSASGAAPDPARRPDPSRKNVIMLALSLALAMTGASIIMTVSALAGHMLAVDKSLATVPMAMQMAFVMISTIPASMLMRRIGRRAGFIVGQGIGLIAGAICVYAISQGSFVLFTVGSALFGSHNAFWQYYRFAAAETADAAFRSRAISLVMSGGVVAAIFGPELSKVSRDMLAPITYAGSYAVIGVLCVATVALLAFINIPKPEAKELKNSGRPLAEIGRQPMFVVAVLSAMVGYGVMALVMTATPIAMMVAGHAFNDSAFVIQWHALGMFAPSFFTGPSDPALRRAQHHLSRRADEFGLRRGQSIGRRGPAILGRPRLARPRLEFPVHRRHRASDRGPTTRPSEPRCRPSTTFWSSAW